MKAKTISLIITIILIIALITAVTIYIIYLYTGNIVSQYPQEIEQYCHIEEENYQNRKVFIITPNSLDNIQNRENKSKSAKLQDEKSSINMSTSEKVILYLHGGSYMAELQPEHWHFFSHLIQDTGVTIVVPDYPLTPQYHYTDVFSMIFPLYKDILEKVGKNNLIVMGDSAGGGMALALLEKAGKENLEQPSQAILISPWLDVSMENPEIEQVQESDKMLNKDLLKMAGVAYAGSEEQIKNYLVSPIYGSLEKLENITIYTGTYDILNPDAHKLVEMAQEKRSYYPDRRNKRSST